MTDATRRTIAEHDGLVRRLDRELQAWLKECREAATR